MLCMKCPLFCLAFASVQTRNEMITQERKRLHILFCSLNLIPRCYFCPSLVILINYFETKILLLAETSFVRIVVTLKDSF